MTCTVKVDYDGIIVRYSYWSLLNYYTMFDMSISVTYGYCDFDGCIYYFVPIFQFIDFLCDYS